MSQVQCEYNFMPPAFGEPMFSITQQQSTKSQTPAMESQRKPRKLRSSCDSCGIAKVRCSKAHPKCERCVENNFACVYGPSMRHGSREKRRKRPEPPRDVPMTTVPLTANSIGYANYEADLQESFMDFLRNFSDVPPQMTAGVDGMQDFDTLLYGPQAPISTPQDHFWPGVSHCGVLPSNIHSTPLSGVAGVNEVDTNFFENMIRFAPTPDVASELEDSSMDDADFRMGLRTPSFSYSQQNSHIQPISDVNPIQSHDCYFIANSTLASLHFRSSRSDSYDTCSGSNPDEILSRSPSQDRIRVEDSLDEILCSTREAMGNVMQCLQCSCAYDSHMAMLYASIIMRILYWHQLASSVSSSSPVSGSFFSGSNVITAEPSKIGGFVADDEDQQLMRRLYFASNLRKLRALIAAFAQGGERMGSGSAGNMHASVVNWLRLELDKAMKEVSKRSQGRATALGSAMDSN